MIRWSRAGTIRRAGITLSLAGAVLVVSSCGDDSLGPADPGLATEAAPALAGVTTSGLSFSQISSGAVHTCGITMDNRLYCWGMNEQGQLGDGTTVNRETPVAVATELRFRQVSAALFNTCGLTTGYVAYCWGSNSIGELGDGTDLSRLTPTRVVGSRQFRQIETRYFHTCAVAYTDGRAYCWGVNNEGQLGDGSRTARTTPVAVSGNLRFRQITTGALHTCGVTPENLAYCWGRNREGQTGDRTDVRRRQRPVLVADGHLFRQLDAGEYHTCGVTTDQRAFCWGHGRYGQLGNGKTYTSLWPRLVSGGRQFGRVSAGSVHTCGETTDHRVYCWGHNAMGELGDGTPTQRLTPALVTGGLIFSQISVGDYHTCGRTGAGVAYCWGYNLQAQLGDGTREDRFSPVPVADPM